ncbi:hypothetical protein TTHERM_00149720 (macronuclear) [Tetrahymena thermophila SB210]|uniref:Uncharacterized protein n=1 Tax=Tetrahymena thermophila (strain SB210) TaxID=312017 RepID=I7MGD7_TETTS|nr:hypothetical protein TTHERM_00149720 [Tetrahymena thermophila SB210]EAS01361.2 hypothetical protein TTHERM_00149720 [Tetrahymena thermophila SB210]|eukprot:XP_001021607.2 hypothetical protein TTHERM_00149720 [Tetrahymena thermophila SB210]
MKNSELFKNDSDRRKEYDRNFHSIKSFTVDLNKLYQVYQTRDYDAKQAWMYIFDYVCLTKIKNQKDCFRKTAIKFYKNYFPEYKYFKENYRDYNAFRNLPNRKNYLIRIKKKSSMRIYEQNFQHDIENILQDQEPEDGKDHEIIFQLKILIKDLLQITYNSFYNESLILNNSRILEYCFQLLKYLEIEYFYCCIAFKIKNEQELLERITCILRRYYHFWVELLFETYCYSYWKQEQTKKNNSVDQKNQNASQREKTYEDIFLEKNKEINERIEKFKNNNGLCKKQQFFEQKNLPNEIEEQQKNETYDFSFLEFNQQDEFDDETLKQRFQRFDLKITDILDYYPFLQAKQNSNRIEIIQDQQSRQGEYTIFLDNIQLLANTNINIIYEFICAEYSNWSYYQGPYTIIIQLFSFLKKALEKKSILIAIVETYQNFKDSNNLKIIYEHDRENNQFFLKQKFKNKQFEFKDEEETDEEYDLEDDQINNHDDIHNIEKQSRSYDDLQIKEDNRKRKEKISRIIEKIINQILQNNCQKLTQIFALYLKDENIQKIGYNIQKMFFIFQFDGIQFQKIQMDDNSKLIYEYNLDDALAFDLQLFICQEQSKIYQQQETVKSQTSSLPALKSDEDNQNNHKLDIKDDQKEITKNDDSIDLEEKFEEKETRAAQNFYESCFQVKHQSKGYIMPIPYENLTFPPIINEPVILPEYNDIQKGTEHLFDGYLLKPQQQLAQQYKSRTFSTVSNAYSNNSQQKKIQYPFKDEEQICDIRIFKSLAQNVAKSIISDYKGPQSKQTDFDYNLQQYFYSFSEAKR